MPTVAAIQMCSSSFLEENLKNAAQLIHAAATRGTQLIVLPEMFPMISDDPKDALTIMEPFGHGPIQEFLANEATRNKVWIVGGTIPIVSKPNEKFHAACLVYNASGELAGRYDKIHLFDANISKNESYHESDTSDPGKTATVVNTPFGKLGLAVCFDLRFPSLFSKLRDQGAEIFAVPSAFTVKTGAAHWELLTRARAIENLCYVIAAAQGGKHSNNRETYGHSIIVEPWGSILQEQKESGNGIIYGEIDLEHQKTLRQTFLINKDEL